MQVSIAHTTREQVARHLLGGLVLALGGCASSPKAPPPELPESNATYQVQLPQPGEAAVRTIQLDLGADLKRCDVEDPHFFYDESVVRPQAVPEMKRLAACLTSEPFSDVDIRLLGRSDPRGSRDYNQELAERRANYVKSMLVDFGVPPDRIEVAARGESEAIGDTAQASYGHDRRVDIVYLQVIKP